MKIAELSKREKILDDFARYFERLERINEKDKEIGGAWFVVAKDDFEVMKLLYENKHYAASCYHMQQCYEKLSKSMMILNGASKPDSVWGHEFASAKIKSLLMSEVYTHVSNLAAIIGVTFEVDISKLEILKKNENEIRKMNKGEIAFVINQIKKIEDTCLSKEFIKKVTESLNVKSKITLIKHIVFQLTHFRVRESQIREKTTEESVTKIIKQMMFSLKLLFICLMLQSHSNTPRYPAQQDEPNFFSYVEGFGAVDFMNTYIEITGQLIADFEQEFLKKSDSSSN